jgi:hypothetical protein
VRLWWAGEKEVRLGSFSRCGLAGRILSSPLNQSAVQKGSPTRPQAQQTSQTYPGVR